MKKMTMAEKAKTRAHMRAAGIDPREVSQREFVDYAKKHGIMDDQTAKPDLSDDADAPITQDPARSENDSDEDDLYELPADDADADDADADDADADDADDADADDADADDADADADADDADADDADADADIEAPELPEPSNPIEQMLDDRIAVHIERHIVNDVHKRGSLETSRAIAKLRKEFKRAVSESASVTMRKRELRKKDKTVTFDHKHKMLDAVAKVVELGKNTYVYGPSQSGKTTMGKQLAQLFDLDFYMIGRVDDIFALTGYNDAQGNYVETDFFRWFTKGGLFLGDEMDRWAVEALTGINAALANGYMSFPHGRFERHPDAVYIAAGNTIGQGHDRVYTAAQALDGSTMARFVKIRVEYDLKLERALALSANPDAGAWVDFVQKARANAEKHRMDIIISPTDSINGAELLAAGFKMDAVKEMTFMAGLSKNQRNQLEA